MMSAKEAFEVTKSVLKDVPTIDELLELQGTIKSSAEAGLFVAFSKPLDVKRGEQLAMELEEFGYLTNVAGSGRYTEDGKPLVIIHINWRYEPSPQSRVIQPVSI